MKYHFGLVWLMVVLVVMIDSFLFWRWRKNGLFNNLTGKLSALFLFGLMPVTAIFGFIYIGLRMPTTDSAQIYVDFGWFLLFFLMVYIAKFFYSSFNGVQLLVNRRLRKPEDKVRHYPRITRRKFLSQLGIIMATAPFISLLFGAFQGRFAFYTRHIKLSFPNLPEGFEGLRIAQISDLHIGSFGDVRDPMKEAVKLVNAAHPDVILFTGDLVNNFAEEVNGWEAIFAELKAPMGKYSILGNHDYGNYSRWSSKAQKEANFQGIVDGHRKIGFTLLRNESVVLTRNGDSIGMGGVENWGTASQPRKGDLNLAQALWILRQRTITTPSSPRWHPNSVFQLDQESHFTTTCSTPSRASDDFWFSTTANTLWSSPPSWSRLFSNAALALSYW